MSSLPKRSVVLLTVALAVAVGGIGGLVAALLVPPGGPDADAIDDTAPSAVDREGARSPRARGDRTARDRRTTRRTRSGDEGGRRRIPRRGGTSDRAALAQRLASPDDATRFGAAIDVILAGGQMLDALSAMDPPTDAGREYALRVREALDLLERQRRTDRWTELMTDRRLELQLAALRSVVPDDYLSEQRAEYWSAKVAGDEMRFEKGHIERGELLFSKAQLALAQAEMGTLPAAEAAAAIAPGREEIRKWVESVRLDNRFVGRRWMDMTASLAAFDQL